MKKVILVTGASSGIGKETVNLLLNDGYIVYAVARRIEKMNDLEARGAKIFFMDVTQDESMVKCVAKIIENEGKIDVLVNNAGFGLNGAVEDVPINDARYQFEVNVFGLARLTQLILPYMRKKKSGTIINISSIGGKICTPMGGWYYASKHALEGLSDSLRMELKQFNINVVLIEPGITKTEWSDIALSSLVRISENTPYQKMAKKYAESIKKLVKNGSFSSDIAKLIIKAMQIQKPKTRYTSGFLAHSFLFMYKWLPNKLSDKIILNKLM